MSLSGGDWADLIVRQQDPNNYYAVRIGKDTGGGTGPVDFIKTVRGKQTTVASGTYTTGASVAVKVKISGSTLTAWVGTGDPKISTTDSDLTAGGFALASHKAEYSNVVVFYDVNANDAYDDGTDNLVVNETFSGTATTPTHDDAGNLTNDGTYKYTYDAWNP